MPWFDVGVNLTNSSFTAQLEAVMARAAEAGVERMVVIGTSLSTSEQAVALAERYPNQLVATVGIHPHDAAAAPADYLGRLAALAEHPQVRAIGECGLDYNRNYSPPAVQRQIFAGQLGLAAELNLPVYLHERDALADQLSLLREHHASLPGLLTHCFTGGQSALEKYLALDCYIGVTGWVCDERRGDELRAAVPKIPADRIMLETDAPYLLPRTLRPKPKTRVNEPCHVPHIAMTLASLRNQSVDELERDTWRNSQHFFAAT